MSTTSLENSAMKSSFSLSSLRASAAHPAHPAHPAERPYHSLTKKRKEPCREAWRRSWGSAASGGSGGGGGGACDDLWPLLQHHYDYIMDNHIIDTCKEANGELSSHNTSVLAQSAGGGGGGGGEGSINRRQWSLSQLTAEFSELCQWLATIQEEIYSSPENLSNRSLRMSWLAEMSAAERRRSRFVEQAAAILERLPEARDEVAWRARHLHAKWECARLLLTPDEKESHADAVDTAHEMKCLRRWLHGMEGRLPPPSLAAARSVPPASLYRRLREHQVLQRDVECHGRIVSSVVRLCGGADAARALERRWHLLYLRAIEWQCHLEACLARQENQGAASPGGAASESDEEPALKQRRLCRPPRPPRPRPHAYTYPPPPHSSGDSSDQSYSEEDQDEEYLIAYTCGASEPELQQLSRADMASLADCARAAAEQSVPRSPSARLSSPHPAATADLVDGPCNEKLEDVSMYEDPAAPRTPPTVVKRKKPVDSSTFNQTDRKSKNCATFYFRHPDTDSDRRPPEERSRESSEEEWTYTADPMTSSVEIQCELPIDEAVKPAPVSRSPETVGKPASPSGKPESHTPDLLREQHSRCKNIERLVNQAEELVQKQQQAAAAGKKTKLSRSFKPLALEQDGKTLACRNKMSRIKEWLQQNNDPTDSFQCTESYDASGEYTTESEVGGASGSGASEGEEPAVAAAAAGAGGGADTSGDTSVCTLTPAHRPQHTKVVLRKKRNACGGTRPWSVSCLSQLSCGRAARAACGGSLDATPTAPRPMSAMSISESALHTLAAQARHMGAAGGSARDKLQSSTSSVKTAVQGHISSSTTINETCVSCYEIGELNKQCSMHRKRLKLRRRQQAQLPGESAGSSGNQGGQHAAHKRGDKLVKSSSFSGRLSPKLEDKHERSAASDPATSRKYRFETTSTSGNDSDDDHLRSQMWNIAHLRRSIERTHISSRAEAAPAAAALPALAAPSFKLGAAGGPVRPRPSLLSHLSLPASDKERNILAVCLGDPGQLWDLADKDSDVDKSVHTAGTEEHSSFSEQAWDFYQEKYNSEPYSEAPDSDAARRLLEFGDDYRAFLDSQSDCCSSLSAHPEPDASPTAARRRHLPRHRRSPGDAPARKPKSMSSAERKKTLLDSLERSRNSASLEGEGRRRRGSERRPDVLPDSDSSSGRARESPDEVEALVARSAARLRDTEALLARDDAPDVLRVADYNEIMSTCRENISCLETVLATAHGAGAGGGGGVLSPAQCHEIRGVSARWSALRSAAARRGNARRLRRELATLRETLADISEPGDAPPQLHTKHHLNRRIDELEERLSRLMEVKVSMLKLTVAARRALSALEGAGEPPGALAAELTALLHAWDAAHHRTSSELLALQKALAAWCEWEAGLRELTSGLRSDHDALRQLQRRGDTGDQLDQLDQLPAQLRHLADVLNDNKKGSSTCGSLSDSGISDGDSEAAAAAAAATGARARRLAALRDLARDLQAALAPGSHAIRAITKRMEQAESEVRALQESCRALVARGAPDALLTPTPDRSDGATGGGNKTGAGEPDYTPRPHWVWRVLRSALPFQLCLVALLLAAWLLERPRCCDLLNSLAGSFTPQLRYVRGPPPV